MNSLFSLKYQWEHRLIWSIPGNPHIFDIASWWQQLQTTSTKSCQDLKPLHSCGTSAGWFATPTTTPDPLLMLKLHRWQCLSLMAVLLWQLMLPFLPHMCTRKSGNVPEQSQTAKSKLLQMEITTSWLQWPSLNYGYLSECGWLNANSFFLVKSFGGEYEHKYVTEKQNSCFMKQDGDLVSNYRLEKSTSSDPFLPIL